MDISKLSQQQKSVVLAKAMDLPIEPHPVHEGEYLIHVPPGLYAGWELFDNFYSLENNECAWYALRWASQNHEWTARIYHFWKTAHWMDDKNKLFLFSMPQRMAQRLILDFVLELTLED